MNMPAQMRQQRNKWIKAKANAEGILGSSSMLNRQEASPQNSPSRNGKSVIGSFRVMNGNCLSLNNNHSSINEHRLAFIHRSHSPLPLYRSAALLHHRGTMSATTQLTQTDTCESCESVFHVGILNANCGGTNLIS